MVNDSKKKDGQTPPVEPLDELLKDATDEQEKNLLTKAWHALSGLGETKHDPPEPSEELAKIFGKSLREFGATKKAGGADMTANAAKLYRKIMSDNAAQAELAKAGGTPESIGAVVRISQRLGQPVTPEEVRDFLEREPGEELSDSELEMVVGGKGNPNELIKGDKWEWIGLPDDDLDGGDGNDTIYGYTGNDTLSGGTGNDQMEGGSGNDILTGGTGNDHMEGGSGNDDMNGGTGEDRMFGGFGDDSMTGGEGHDSMAGGEGNDTMKGGAGNDILHGEGGSDWMSGGLGNDSMTGGEGNDYMGGGAGNDTMDGGDGNDYMEGGAGNDAMNGGDGNDRMWGDTGNDTMDGGAGNDKMSGGLGNDSMSGGAGSDTMSGGSGDDTMSGGAGRDILTGGSGADIFVFGNDDGNDVVTDFNPNEDFLRFNDGDLGNIEVANVGGNTVISYGNTMITLEGVEMDKDQVLARVQT
jgi:Ca2+-binding RTX toxin-like protein